MSSHVFFKVSGTLFSMLNTLSDSWLVLALITYYVSKFLCIKNGCVLQRNKLNWQVPLSRKLITDQHPPVSFGCACVFVKPWKIQGKSKRKTRKHFNLRSQGLKNARLKAKSALRTFFFKTNNTNETGKTGKKIHLIFLISARENWGTEIRDWSKVMLKSLLVCPWLADSSLSCSGGILVCATTLALLSHCQRGKGQLFKVSHVLAKQRQCFLQAGDMWAAPQALQLVGKEQVLGISITLSWAHSEAAAFCWALLLTQPYYSVLWCFFKSYGFSSRYRGLQ